MEHPYSGYSLRAASYIFCAGEGLRSLRERLAVDTAAVRIAHGAGRNWAGVYALDARAKAGDGVRNGDAEGEDGKGEGGVANDVLHVSIS